MYFTLKLRCRTLPKEMKDWPAFIDLKNKIENFADSCPLLEIMVNDAMKPRHWQKLEVLLNTKFDVESPNFTLGDIMAAPLLKYKDDIEVSFTIEAKNSVSWNILLSGYLHRWNQRKGH